MATGKFKTTRTQLFSRYSVIIKTDYCDIQHLLNYKRPIAYNAGVYGWNYDVYEITPNTAICTGYNPISNYSIPYTITRKFDNKAKTLIYSHTATPEQMEQLLNELIQHMEVIK